MRICLLAIVLGLPLLGCAHAPPPTGGESTGEPAADETAAPAVAERPKDLAPEVKEARSQGVISRAELNAVLDGAPGRFLQHVQTEPRFVAGRFHGWRLASFFPGDARFSGLDLRAGDVVTAVNGRSIEQPEQLMEVWEALRFERTLTITLERDGRARQLRFEIRD